MDDPKSLAIPTIKQPIEEGKPYLIEIRTPCPICNASWAATFREKIAKVSQIAGSIGETFVQGGRKAIKINTSGWGAHALCGDCYAMRIVTIEPTDGGRRIIPWTPKIEAEMFGYLKHQQTASTPSPPSWGRRRAQKSSSTSSRSGASKSSGARTP